MCVYHTQISDLCICIYVCVGGCIYTHTHICVYHTQISGTLGNHKNEKFATAWMDLEGIMLSEISQMQKDRYCMISLICGIEKKNETSV